MTKETERIIRNVASTNGLSVGTFEHLAKYYYLSESHKIVVGVTEDEYLNKCYIHLHDQKFVSVYESLKNKLPS
jgi:hypothetical protein